MFEFLKTNKKIGLVLSGGGTRGFAHLGVFKALKEKNIKPDIISGTSAGAIIGAFMAAGNAPEELFSMLNNRSFFSFSTFKLKKSGMIELDGLKKEMKKHIKADKIENLDIPLIISTTNLNKGKVEYHSKGDLITHVMASASIPVLFTPVELNGDLHVDGGLFDNLPVSPIREKCETIIGVNISPIQERNDISSMMDISARTFHLTVHVNTIPSREKCDILIEPLELSKYSILDTKNAKELFELGYKTAMDTDFSAIQ